jgi:hypothetical protein
VSAVEVIPPSADNPLPSSRRITPERFASATQSGLQVEVSPGPNDIDLDLASEADSTEADAAERDVTELAGEAGEQPIGQSQDAAQK